MTDAGYYEKGKAVCRKVLDPGAVLATSTTAENLVFRAQSKALMPACRKEARSGVGA